MPLFEKVILAIQETSTSCHIIRTNIFHFTDGEGLMVNFRYFALLLMMHFTLKFQVAVTSRTNVWGLVKTLLRAV